MTKHNDILGLLVLLMPFLPLITWIQLIGEVVHSLPAKVL